ncbi:MAG TPA: glycosyltransferase [Symbiobacteriaceae bacterium]|nr:glycosyltransferase [Symbiobacteriaceae bacterium]
MRICLFQTMPRSGLAFYGHCLADALGAEGHQVDLLTTVDYEYRSERYRILNWLRPFGASKSGFLRKISSLWSYWLHACALTRLVRRADPPYDVVHLQVPYIVFHWLFARLLRGHGRVVGTVHDVIPHVPVLHPTVDRLFSQWTFSAFDRLIVHSQENEEQLHRHFRVAPDSVHVVPHGVFYYGHARQMPEPAGEHLRLLFFGGIRPNKGLGVLLEAMTLIRSVKAHLVIAGAGGSADSALLERYRNRFDKLGVDHRITWYNRFIKDEEVPDLLSSVDAVVLPYTSFASQSGVLNVAIAYSRPVVVTDVGSMGATVREYGNGKVVPPQDAAALAIALEGLAPGSPEYDRMVKGAARARSELDWNRIAQRTVKSVYQG